jgi:2-polyprenyl-3-methyl-5-hydroxy-6-metoxy-1,4-benzoquinol methylase
VNGYVEQQHVRCNLCGADDTRFRFHKNNLTIVQCRRCGLVYTNPRLPKEHLWTRYNERYFWDEYLAGLEIGRDGRVDLERFDAHHAPMLHLFQMYRPPPGRLLEVGAAAGIFLKTAQRARWDVAGVEPMAFAAAFARERLGLDVREGTLQDAAFADASFDAVAMFETIEHLMDPKSVLREIRRVLRPRGLLVLSTPNWEAVSRHALGRQWAVISPAEHLYYLSEATLTAMLRDVGFSWVHYHRDYAAGPHETMHADHTNSPGSVRHRLYAAAVRYLGNGYYREVQRRGLSDQLVCVAYA